MWVVYAHRLLHFGIVINVFLMVNNISAKKNIKTVELVKDVKTYFISTKNGATDNSKLLPNVSYMKHTDYAFSAEMIYRVFSHTMLMYKDMMVQIEV